MKGLIFLGDADNVTGALWVLLALGIFTHFYYFNMKVGLRRRVSAEVTWWVVLALRIFNIKGHDRATG